ncbi:hypothetical protein QQM79_11410 [Marinobacteraceae bacterium S3BR75-40.1]
MARMFGQGSTTIQHCRSALARRTSAAAVMGMLSGVTVLYGEAAFAEPVQVDTGVSALYSDNMDRRENNPESDIRYRPFVAINHITDPGTCESRLASEVAYLFYENNTSDDQSEISLGWDGDCEIGSYLSWMAHDSIRQVVSDNRAVDTPNNRERRNVFETGPRLEVPLGRTTSFFSSVKWQKTSFQDTEEDDSERWIGNAGLSRQFSPYMTGSLQYSLTDAEFENGDTLTQKTTSVGLERQFNKNRVSGQVGYSQLESETATSTNDYDAVTWDLSASRQLDAARSARLSVSRQLTDTSTDIDIQLGGIDFTLTDTQALEITVFRLDYEEAFQSGLSANLFTTYTSSDYVETERKETSWQTGLNLAQQVSSLVTFQGALSYERERFEPEGLNSNLYQASIGIDYQRTQDLRLGASVGHNLRDADAQLIDYRENWVKVSLSYNLR